MSVRALYYLSIHSSQLNIKSDAGRTTTKVRLHPLVLQPIDQEHQIIFLHHETSITADKVD